MDELPKKILEAAMRGDYRPAREAIRAMQGPHPESDLFDLFETLGGIRPDLPEYRLVHTEQAEVMSSGIVDAMRTSPTETVKMGMKPGKLYGGLIRRFFNRCVTRLRGR